MIVASTGKPSDGAVERKTRFRPWVQSRASFEGLIVEIWLQFDYIK